MPLARAGAIRDKLLRVCVVNRLSAVCGEYYPECKNSALRFAASAAVAGGKKDDGWIVLLVVLIPAVLAWLMITQKK